ncbi:hypothetical protein I302_101745 [Kwoniella bestiolae CBS 10118]|uniref:P-loop containing nucleoside triphosphate hydrolase protein n=1 Tax=Kwoniella bestiolae CBS 10118 TaxID=1296100 RepID=A0AAJ8K2J2_9TREE
MIRQSITPLSTLVRTHRPLIRISPQPLLNIFHRHSSTATIQSSPRYKHEYQDGPGLEPKIDIEDHQQFAASIRTGDIPLRYYQKKAIVKCLKSYKEGMTRMGVFIPTGGGKTSTMMHLYKRFVDRYPTCGLDSEKPKMLVLTHKRDLVHQTYLNAKRILGEGYSIEIEQGDKVASGVADVTTASIQTIMNPARLSKFNPRHFGMVLVDEAHHAASPSWLNVLHHFNSQIDKSSSPEFTKIISPSHSHNVPIVGFPATFQRFDERSLKKAFQKIIYHLPLRRLIEEGESKKKEDYNTSRLAKLVNTHEVNKLVVRIYQEKASERRSTLIFCVNLNQLQDLTEAFIKAGYDARAISGDTPPVERRKTMDDFGKGRFPILLNCQVVIEGIDIPEIDSLIMARPTKSPNLLHQMVGRGLRLSTEIGKKDCLIIDLVDNQSKIGSMDLMSEEWLDQARRRKGMDEGGSSLNQAAKEPQYTRNDQHKADQFRITYISIDPFDLNQTADNSTILLISKNAWVSCGADLWVLQVLGKGYFAIQRVGTEGKDSNSLSECVRSTDWLIESRTRKNLYNQLSRHAPWRKEPATEPAVQKLLSYTTDDPLSAEELGHAILTIHGQEYKLSGLTKGQVSSWLCAIQFGDKALRGSVRLISNEAERDRGEQRRITGGLNVEVNDQD